MQGFLGAFAAIVLGGAIGGVTIFGIVSNTLNSSSDNPGNVGGTASYGATK